jgi:tRNA threonylcarbamoyladenosine biosynthesis protein TsaB
LALILNLETATTVCSVALAKDGELLALKEINGDYSHAENLTVFIEEVLQQANIKINDVDAIAVSKGPGSYTGLRIGVSTAKGLSYSLDKPLIAINTLQSLAHSVASRFFKAEYESEFLFCPMIDARRMEVYCALYDKYNNCVMPTSALIIDENSFDEYIRSKYFYFFGDGAEKCKNIISSEAIYLKEELPSAKNMIPLSEQAYNKNEFEDVAYFEPFYLKDFVAGKKKGEK